MFDAQQFFGSAGSRTLVFTRTALAAQAAGWAELRMEMIRSKPAAFTRDEWAYLISFLDKEALERLFVQAFGQPGTGEGFSRTARPVDRIGIWLPNNVSLLGPLMVVMTSLVGSEVVLKAGSKSENLVEPFLEFCRQHGNAQLRDSIRHFSVLHAARGDSRVVELSRAVNMRIVFGGDTAVSAVRALPQRIDARFIGFANKHSEAWLPASAITPATCDTLLRVFLIYGQAGCTSPKRVVVLDGDADDATRLARGLLESATRMKREAPSAHASSQAVLGTQLARMAHWQTYASLPHACYFAVGSIGTSPVPNPRGLHVVHAPREIALASLPDNTQTVGHVLDAENARTLVAALAQRRVSRFVPLGQMHHFGPLWDGYSVLADCFEWMELA